MSDELKAHALRMRDMEGWHMKSDTSAPKSRQYQGHPRWLREARQLVDANYYKVHAGLMAHIIATALEAAYSAGVEET